MNRHTHGSRFDVIGFDADDTLWRNEDYFTAVEQRFVELITPYATHEVDPMAMLTEIETASVSVTGYGVTAFALSMVQAAVRASAGQIPATVIDDLVNSAYRIFDHPVELLDGVIDTLTSVASTHRVVMITKGDLLHQGRKIRASGIDHHFDQIEVVATKDADTYRRVLDRWGIDPTRFAMVGNSVPSDILPVLSIGGCGIHIEYHTTWVHETIDDHDGEFTTLSSIAELPHWLATEI